MIVSDDFYKAVLQQIGAPSTENNISILRAWQKTEGGNATYNPLNTTKSAPGATNYNSAGVKNFPDFATGVNATSLTIMNGYYPNILNNFRLNKSISQWMGDANIQKDLHTWGSVTFANQLKNSTPVIPTNTTEKKKSFCLSY